MLFRSLAKTPRRALLLRSLRPRPRRLVTAWSLWRADRFRLLGWDLLLSRLCVNLLRLHLLLRVRLSRSALIVGRLREGRPVLSHELIGGGNPIGLRSGI